MSACPSPDLAQICAKAREPRVGLGASSRRAICPANVQHWDKIDGAVDLLSAHWLTLGMSDSESLWKTKLKWKVPAGCFHGRCGCGGRSAVPHSVHKASPARFQV